MRRREFIALFIVLGPLLLTQPAVALFKQQGTKLVGSSAIPPPYDQGRSVSLSADGSTAIVGGPSTDGSGAVWFFTRSAGQWMQQALRRPRRPAALYQRRTRAYEARTAGIIRLTYQNAACSGARAPAKSAEADAPDEIEITPAMIAAGVSAYFSFNPLFESEEDGVIRIFSAMLAARPCRVLSSTPQT